MSRLSEPTALLELARHRTGGRPLRWWQSEGPPFDIWFEGDGGEIVYVGTADHTGLAELWCAADRQIESLLALVARLREQLAELEFIDGEGVWWRGLRCVDCLGFANDGGGHAAHCPIAALLAEAEG